MLLDPVSVLLLTTTSHLHSSASFSLSFDRVFSASLASAIPSFISPAYVQLAKEFDVSVDQVVSSFSASYLGSGIVLCVRLRLV